MESNEGFSYEKTDRMVYAQMKGGSYTTTALTSAEGDKKAL